MKIQLHKIDSNYPYNLLLLADETIEAIDKYLFHSDVYVAKLSGEVVGVACVLRIDERTVEIMNIAVAENMQDMGIGSRMIEEIEKIARVDNYRTIIVGTADCGLRQIRFYEKNGFARYAVKKNYFVEKYDRPIYENGVQLIDMVMLKKEIQSEVTGKESFFMMLDLLEKLNTPYWVIGGWNVDVLIGKQTRPHRDIDINFDAAFEELLMNKLEEIGYEITTDWRPCRIELHHPKHGYVNIHPLKISEAGDAKQAMPDGGWYDYKAEWFTECSFEGKIIPCFSLQAQRLFHSGYELKEVDKLDMKRLNKAFPEE